ncbi:MAG: hypothetical protein R3C10_25580 [Pirellulales bacterium]
MVTPSGIQPQAASKKVETMSKITAKKWLATVSFVLVLAALIVGGMFVYQGEIGGDAREVPERGSRESTQRARNTAKKSAQNATKSPVAP